MLDFKKLCFVGIISILILFVASSTVSADSSVIRGDICDSHLEVDDKGNFEGYIKLNLSINDEYYTNIDNITDDLRNGLNDIIESKNIYTGTIWAGEPTEFISLSNGSIVSISLDDKILTINFKGTDEDSDMGKFSGNITSFETLGDDNNNNTIYIEGDEYDDGVDDTPKDASSNNSSPDLNGKSADELLEESGWKKSSESSSARIIG